MLCKAPPAHGQHILGNVVDAVIQNDRPTARLSMAPSQERVDASVIQRQPRGELDGLTPVLQPAPVWQAPGQCLGLRARGARTGSTGILRLRYSCLEALLDLLNDFGQKLDAL